RAKVLADRRGSRRDGVVDGGLGQLLGFRRLRHLEVAAKRVALIDRRCRRRDLTGALRAGTEREDQSDEDETLPHQRLLDSEALRVQAPSDSDRATSQLAATVRRT